MRQRILLLCYLLLAGCSKAPVPEFGPVELLPVPANGDSLGPRLTAGSGQLLLSWMERDDEGATLKVTELGKTNWGPAIDVVSDPRMFVNWADLPSVLSVVKGAGANSQWAAHWLSRRGDDPHAYDLRVALSADGGAHWSQPVTPHTDGTLTEHGFAAKFRSPKGVGILWLDGRRYADDSASVGGATETLPGTALRSAVVTPTGTLADEILVDDLVCDCCPTSVVVTSSGPMAVYRDRSVDNVRDIAVTRFNNGAWSPAAIVAADHWRIDGCPVNGPVIAASGDLAGVAWYTAADGAPKVRAAISRDGGATFPEPTDIAAGAVSGHVDIVFTRRSTFVVSWLEKSGDEFLLRIRSLHVDGPPGSPVTVAAMTNGPQVPQMEYRQDELVLAWTDGKADGAPIRSARVPLGYGTN